MITLYWYKENVLCDLDVVPSDESVREMSIMGAHTLSLIFNLTTYVDIPTGAWCEFEGCRYELLTPATFVKNGNRKWEYALTMAAPDGLLARWKVRNPADGSLEFPYTATPAQHIELLVDILNFHTPEGGATWRAGACLNAPAKLVNYNHTQLDAALAELASLFETEWEVVSESELGLTYNTIYLNKVEHFKDSPIYLSYGREGGFLPGIKRQASDEQAVDRLYIQGTEENISAAGYNPLGAEVGSRRLLLPLGQELGYDGQYYSDQVGYYGGQMYKSSSDGLSITLAGNEDTRGSEDSIDCTDIVPAKELITAAVETQESVDSDGAAYFEYNLVLGVPEDEDYRDYQVEGEVAYIAFQSGKLAGREFDIHTLDDGTLDIAKVYDNETFVGWRFKLVGAEQDGYFMPSETWPPQVGDKVKVFGIQLPESAICDNSSKSGASWEMFRQAVRALWQRNVGNTHYEGEISTAWVSRNWEAIGAKVRIGGYVRFDDEVFEKKGILIRITAVKTFVNNTHAPQITLSNEVSGSSIKTTLEHIKGEEVVVSGVKKNAIDFTRRRFRDAQESQNLLAAALQTEFTESISPVAINTMQAIFGATSLQYTFVKSLTDMTPTTYQPTISNEVLSMPPGYIKHETLGIEVVTPERQASDYQRWTVIAETLAFEEPDKAYYLYLRASTAPGPEDAEPILSLTPIEFDASEDYYYFLLATIGRLVDGERSYQAWNGFTEVTPGAIRANRFVSVDGLQYIDFATSEFRVGDGTSYIKYAEGTLEVSGAFIGDAVLGKEIKVLDSREQVAAGLSGIDGQPLIYGAMQTKVWYHWKTSSGTLYYTLIAPSAIGIGTTDIALYEEPDERSELASTARYVSDGVIGYRSVSLYKTDDVTINNNTVSKARYQLQPSGLQMIGTPNGRRIEIQPGKDTAAIVVYDDSGVARATISDTVYDDIDDITPPADSFSIEKFYGEYLIYGNPTQVYTTDYSVQFTSGAGTLWLPQLDITHTFNSSGFTETERSVVTRIYYLIDGVPYRILGNDGSIDAYGVTTQTASCPSTTISVSKGNHTLTIRLWQQYVYTPSGYITPRTTVEAVAPAEVVYDEYKATLFTNGLAVAKSSNEMLVAIDTDEGMKIRGQVNNYGIDISDSGIALRVNGNWYELSVVNSYIKGTVK